MPKKDRGESLQNIQYLELSGEKLLPYIEELASLRIKVFREFPYLYDGSLDYERKYLDVYVKSQDSLVVLALAGDKIIGATTCLPMKDESSEFKSPLLNKGLDINQVYYFGESIILSQYRGHGIGHKFFEFRERQAKKIIPNLKYTCFCAVKRPEDHHRKPANYKPLDEFWTRMGYQKQLDLNCNLKWKDIDEDIESTKELNFWLKEF